MTARGVTVAGPGFDFGRGNTVTDTYLAAKPGLRLVDARRYAPELWHQVAAVDACITGAPWQARVRADAPVPSWLIDLTAGHVCSAADVPTPTLFRTAGIGTGWLDTPAQLCFRRGRFDVRARLRLGRLLYGIEQAGGVADADVYVLGDGNPDGVIRAQAHAVFGRFDALPPARVVSAFSVGFTVGPPIRQGSTVTLTWTPHSGRTR